MTDCVFCKIVAGEAPAKMVREWDNAIAFTPLNPVNPGHILVIPRCHVDDATVDPDVTANTMYRAAELAGESDSANILTSIGKPATQSIFHLHIHVVPREAGDQLMLPWGTTGNPHDPHWCKVADRLKRQLDGLSADPATIERVAAAVLAAMRDLSRESRWWAAMRTVEIPDNEQAAKFISEAAVRALQGEA